MKAYWITVILGICLSFATIAPKVAIAQEVAASTIEAQDGGNGSLLITESSSPAGVLSGSAEAYEQYTQATCLLIRHEMGSETLTRPDTLNCPVTCNVIVNHPSFRIRLRLISVVR